MDFSELLLSCHLNRNGLMLRPVCAFKVLFFFPTHLPFRYSSPQRAVGYFQRAVNLDTLRSRFTVKQSVGALLRFFVIG